jgi:hypothetical protein
MWKAGDHEQEEGMALGVVSAVVSEGRRYRILPTAIISRTNKPPCRRRYFFVIFA